MTKRRSFSDKFKAAAALDALSGDKTVSKRNGLRIGSYTSERPHAALETRTVDTAWLRQAEQLKAA
jgi:hypothetical protein